ncbi:uncharacterized protein LOC111322890 [Stylophora pistillata]|uniref:uncharacterized protein LOC111322890 n=1 Tax=Stylophora pistillata TaxID=50429 RepID=UPI000C051F24|nr:uncharacterized protein LOC111322890 [Stylophora pistillata]
MTDLPIVFKLSYLSFIQDLANFDSFSLEPANVTSRQSGCAKSTNELQTCSGFIVSVSAYSDCIEVDWNISLGSAGWASCPLGKYLRGVSRAHITNPDGIDNIKAGKCCTPPHEFLDQDTECKTVNWKTRLSKNHKWASCPEGYFLRGFYYSNKTLLNNIEQAWCCRPKNYISRTKECYLQDVGIKLDKEGWSTCGDWYHMAGVYRGGCNFLHCIETLTCCKIMAQGVCYR